MSNLEDVLQSAMGEILASGDYDLNSVDLGPVITEAITDLTESKAGSVLEAIKSGAASGLEAKRRQQRQFETRLEDRWRKPLDLLELFVSVATEAGHEFNTEFREDAVRSRDAVFEALTRLHAKACQTSRAILTLLRSGYADDAHARWRSVHEISAFSYFISKHGQEMAERYLLHALVHRYKLACQYQKYAGRSDYEPLPQEELDELRSEYDELLARFGDSYKGDYGWATSVNKSINTIRDIEEDIGLDHMRPYYKMASDNEHPNAHGIYFRLGLGLGPDDVLLAGPSDAGLVDPGHSTAISLNQITTTLLATRSTFSHIVTMNVLRKLTDEIGQVFLQSHRQLEAVSTGSDKMEPSAK